MRWASPARPPTGWRSSPTRSPIGPRTSSPRSSCTERGSSEERDHMKLRAIAAVTFAAGLVLAACGSDDKSDSTSAPTTAAAATTSAAAGSPTTGGSAGSAPAGSAPVGDSATLAKAKSRGHLIIGVKEDQPNLGYRDPTTGQFSGFDIEIARNLATGLGFDVAGIEYKAIPSANREDEISAGNIDYYVGTYSITDSRKERISFGGPYFITGPDTLKGKTTCSVTGSTSLKRIKEEYGGDTIELEKYSLCVDQLLDGEVDAVTTDDAILKGYAAQDPDNLRVVGKPFSEERYGIGITKGDTALCEQLNGLLE